QTSNNTIGGISTTPGQNPGNLIAGNGGRGVNVTSVSTNGIVILGNSIHSNGSLGIDLGNDGVTMNDSCDPDITPNNLQNFPVITNVLAAQGLVSISGTLNSTANTTFRLEFFSNTLGDLSGFGEGKTLLGSANVTTPVGACDVSF